jgi:hypothetical protein
MLEWTAAGAGARLKMLLLHDDAAREYAYGPAHGLPDTKVGILHARAVRRGEEGRLDGDSAGRTIGEASSHSNRDADHCSDAVVH